MISKDDFMEYFKTADKVIRLPACGGEAEDGALEVAEEPDPGETVHIPEEELAEAFPGLYAEGEDGISPARLSHLGLEEIVEVIGGPVQERVAGVQRTQVRALR